MIPPRRTLAFVPASKGLAFAVLEGGDVLLDWGLLHVPKADVSRALSRAFSVAAAHAVDLVVVEDWSAPASLRRDVVRVLLATLVAACDERGLAAARIPRTATRERFAHSPRASKFALAQAVAARFPELAHRLPPKRKPWMSEDPRFAIFEAAALTTLA